MSKSASWAEGYISEIPYTFGFYRELTPEIHNFALGLKGVALGATITERFNYCELGCGQGVSAALLAATHPGAQFYATDFNPAHTAHGRWLAAAANISNVEFFDDSFEEFLNRDLPKMDVIALHGVYSWVSPNTRQSIVAFIKKYLKVGGHLYISYNALPGWSTGLPLRELMVTRASGSSEPIEKRIDTAIQFASRLEAVNAKYFTLNPSVKGRLERLGGMTRNYLAHEYFNRDWHPQYFFEVAKELTEAKVDFVASAHLTDHVDPVNFSTDQIQLLGEVMDPIERETIRDFMTTQQFRRDLFVRGVFRPSLPEQLEQLMKMRFTLSQLPADTPRKITGVSGEAELQKSIYDPIISALGEGTTTLRQLCQRPEIAPMSIPVLLQALTILVGGGSLQPSFDLGMKAESQRKRSTDTFNRAILDRARFSGDLTCLASPVTGGGVTADRFEQLFLLARQANRSDAPQFAWAILNDQNQRLIRDGKTLETPEENIAELTEKFTVFNHKRLPVLKQLGIV